jgi:hypothetical protein
MKPTHRLALTVLAVPALLALSPRADRIEFRAVSGLALERSYSSQHDLELEDMEVLMNGSPSPMMPDMEMTMSMTGNYKIADVYGESAGGRPIKLVRKFDQLDQLVHVKMSGAPVPNPDMKMEANSGLEGKSVVFQWNADEKSYDTSFEGEAGDEALLEGLVEDMDYRFLLPDDGEAAEGDTWDVPTDRLRDLFMPGGDLKLIPDTSASGMGMSPGQGASDMFAGEFEGKCQATYKGQRDGKAVIALMVDAKVKSDGTEAAKKQLQEMPGGITADVDHVDIEVEIKGEGEFLWDLANGVPVQLSLEGTMRVNNDSGMNMEMGGQKMELETHMVLAGNFTGKVDVTQAER